MNSRTIQLTGVITLWVWLPLPAEIHYVDAISLVKDGESGYTIVIAADAPPPDRSNAAGDRQPPSPPPR